MNPVKRLAFFLLIIFFFLLTSCTSVKEYQKIYLNDAEMKLENRKSEIFEVDFQSYREGAVGGTIGNSGSGCGCN